MQTRRLFVAAMVVVAVFATRPAAAQDIAIKGGVAVSRFAVDGTTPFDERLTAATYGGHVRVKLGPIPLQPELYLVTRGSKVGATEDAESMRLEYLEIPVLVVLPVSAGDFELFAVGGPMIALEARCRHVIEQDGLKTSFGCDPPRPQSFSRRAFDYGAVAGAGISHRLGGGRILLEGRHTWGLRNIFDDSGDTQLRNRTFSVMIGYAIMRDRFDGF